MNYPDDSQNQIGLVNGKFSDALIDPNSPPSVDPASWANAVTDEILNVLAAANITPNVADTSQLAAAIIALVGGAVSNGDADTVDGMHASELLDLANAVGTLAANRVQQGAGSGLDADSVDGQHAADLLNRANHTGTNDADTLGGQNLAWVRNLTNALGTLAANRVQQGAGSTLDADMVDGLHADEVVHLARISRYNHFWYDTGGGSLGSKVVSGTENIAPGVYEYENLTIQNGATLRVSASNGQLVLRVKGTAWIGGTIDASGRGGIGGAESFGADADGQGDGAQTQTFLGDYIGGAGGSGHTVGGQNNNGGKGGGTRYFLAAAGQSTDGAGWSDLNLPPNTQEYVKQESYVQDLLQNWRLSFKGGSGGGGTAGGADSNGGNGGGIVIIIAQNLHFEGGVIDCRGRENLDRSGDNDLQDAGCGGGGVAITASHSFSYTTPPDVLITGNVPNGFGNGDTSLGGRGFARHLDISE